MQNDTTFTRTDAAQYDSALTLMLSIVGTGKTLSEIRDSLVEFVGDAKAGAWFDWEFGLARPKYAHSALSNGKVVSERVSG